MNKLCSNQFSIFNKLSYITGAKKIKAKNKDEVDRYEIELLGDKNLRFIVYVYFPNGFNSPYYLLTASQFNGNKFVSDSDPDCEGTSFKFDRFKDGSEFKKFMLNHFVEDKNILSKLNC